MKYWNSQDPKQFPALPQMPSMTMGKSHQFTNSAILGISLILFATSSVFHQKATKILVEERVERLSTSRIQQKIPSCLSVSLLHRSLHQNGKVQHLYPHFGNQFPLSVISVLLGSRARVGWEMYLPETQNWDWNSKQSKRLK